MLRIILSCASVPALYFMSNRLDLERARRLGDLVRDGLRRSDVQRSVRDLLIELRATHRSPTALSTDAVVHRLERRPHLLARLLVGIRNVPRRVDADRQLRCAHLRERLMVERHIRFESPRISTDDRERERKLILRGPDH